MLKKAFFWSSAMIKLSALTNKLFVSMTKMFVLTIKLFVVAINLFPSMSGEDNLTVNMY